MDGKYWSLDDFLAEDEYVSVVAAQNCYNLAILDNSVKKDAKDLESGKKFDTPLWLAVKLGSRDFLNMEIPLIFKDKFQKILIADPTVVNLRDKSYYYYEVGAKICGYIDDKELVPLISNALLTRLKVIQKKSFCLTSEELGSFVKKLTNTERQIFEAGRSSLTTYKLWKDGSADTNFQSTTSKLRKKVKKN